MTLVSRRVRVDGADLNVMIAGAGPDVLLVHGFPDDHTVWRLQIPALVEAGYRVIAVDTRGCGASTVPAREADYRIEQLVDDLVAVLDALEVRKVRVVGHDWGALQSWMLAARHPERVVSLIALAVGHPGAYARGGLMQKLRGYYVLLLQLRGLIEHCLRVRNWRALGVIAGYDPELAHWKTLLGRPGRLTAGCNYYRANLRLFVSPFDERIGVPTVGVWSSGDRFLTERQMQYSASYCDAGWQYVRLDGPNHWPQLSAPARLNALLLQHLAA